MRAPLLSGDAVARSAAWTGHHGLVLLHDILRPGVPVFLALNAAAGVAGPVERVNVAFLPSRARFAAAPAEQPLPHGRDVPEAPLH